MDAILIALVVLAPASVMLAKLAQRQPQTVAARKNR